MGSPHGGPHDDSLRRETEKRFRSRVDTLKPDAPARWGKMNARQMVCHLTDSFRVALGEVPVVAKWTPLRLYPLRWLFVYTLPIPRGKVPTTPEFQVTKPGEWEKDVADVERRLRPVREAFEGEGAPLGDPPRIRGPRHRRVGPARRPPLRPPPDAVRGLTPAGSAGPPATACSRVSATGLQPAGACARFVRNPGKMGLRTSPLFLPAESPPGGSNGRVRAGGFQ